MIVRYIWTDEKMFDADDGDFVTYADHQREVAQLQARVAELEAALDGAVLAERAECAAMAEAFKVHGYDYTGNFELHEAIRDRKNLGFGA